MAAKRCGQGFLIISLKIDEGFMCARLATKREKFQERESVVNCVSDLFATSLSRLLARSSFFAAVCICMCIIRFVFASSDALKSLCHIYMLRG